MFLLCSAAIHSMCVCGGRWRGHMCLCSTLYPICAQMHTHTHTHTYIYILMSLMLYIYICHCECVGWICDVSVWARWVFPPSVVFSVCVCVCVCACMCVCMHVCLCECMCMCVCVCVCMCVYICVYIYDMYTCVSLTDVLAFHHEEEPAWQLPVEPALCCSGVGRLIIPKVRNQQHLTNIYL